MPGYCLVPTYPPTTKYCRIITFYHASGLTHWLDRRDKSACWADQRIVSHKLRALHASRTQPLRSRFCQLLCCFRCGVYYGAFYSSYFGTSTPMLSNFYQCQTHLQSTHFPHGHLLHCHTPRIALSPCWLPVVPPLPKCCGAAINLIRPRFAVHTKCRTRPLHQNTAKVNPLILAFSNSDYIHIVPHQTRQSGC